MIKINYLKFEVFLFLKIIIKTKYLGIGDWGLGIGDWGLGPIPNPQSPIPNPQDLDAKIKIVKIIILF